METLQFKEVDADYYLNQRINIGINVNENVIYDNKKGTKIFKGKSVLDCVNYLKKKQAVSKITFSPPVPVKSF